MGKWTLAVAHQLPSCCQPFHRHLVRDVQGENESFRGRSQEATPECEGEAWDNAHEGRFENPCGWSSQQAWGTGDSVICLKEAQTPPSLAENSAQLARFDLFIHLRFSVCSLNAPGPCFSRLFSFSFVVTATATREFEKLRAGEDEFALRRWLESFADPTGASRSEDSCSPSMGPWAWVNFPVATCPPERSSPSVKLSPTKQ